MMMIDNDDVGSGDDNDDDSDGNVDDHEDNCDYDDTCWQFSS